MRSVMVLQDGTDDKVCFVCFVCRKVPWVCHVRLASVALAGFDLF